VIGLLQNGETVESIVTRCFPNITRAQVYECLAYYEDHRARLTCWWPARWRAHAVKFLLDQDVPDDVSFSLEALGHAVVKLREVLPVRTPDDEVLRQAAARNCLLITCNRDDFLAAAGECRTAESLS